MVRAILDGRKSQTRRVVKVKHAWNIEERDDGTHWPWHPDYVTGGEWDGWVRCPYGLPGDRLWLRESYRLCAEADAVKARETDAAYRVWYEADAPHQPGEGKLRPGIFMPRWASRFTLEVSGVRVERLCAISEADAIAEGSQEPSLVPIIGACWTERDAYAKLWESINGPGSWDANPWVWVVEFRQVTQ